MPNLELVSTAGKLQRGRPPRLSLEVILRIAGEIGLSTVSLKDVATRLGVTVPALYRYVKNREELVSLAAFERALQRQMPASKSAHWSELVRGYALGMFELFVAEPQLINEIMNGALGPDAEVDFIENFIASLRKSGFNAAEAIQVHHSVAMLAVGAAVGTIAIRTTYSGGHTRAAAMQSLLAQRDPAELPEIRSALADYAEVDERQWHRALDTLLAGVAAGRHELLPNAAADLRRPRRVPARRTTGA